MAEALKQKAVSFTCQSCHLPVRLDQSLRNLQPEEHKDLATLARAVRPKEIVAQEKEYPAARTYRSADDTKPVVDFSNTELWARDASSAQLTMHLFDTLSEHGAVDHPLCEDCTDALMQALDMKVAEAETKCRTYSDFLSKHSIDAKSELALRNETAGLKQELDQATAEEASLMQQLDTVEAERAKLKSELEKTQKSLEEIEKKEQTYWTEYANYHMRLRELHQESCSVDAKMQYAKVQLERIKRTNVFNDAFHIWYDGHFGTINRFRLGRLPSIPVEWAEVNAAWGMTVLLLSTMAERLLFRFKGYNLVAFGSLSRLEKTDEASKELPLYVPSGVKMFWESRFNSAMVAFLECLQQLKDYIEQCDPHFKLPYRVMKDKIGDTHGLLSIRYQMQNEEVWTKACKFLLTNLKWCLAWVCKQTELEARKRSGSVTA
eukprot:m.146343 g.146343  ORF g.146343 m.146343 type:complete len:434 (-) comp16806_c0_seq2:1945-3246(-)